MSDDTKTWRTIVIRTDGLKWEIDPNETNSSVLEIKQICSEIIRKFDNFATRKGNRKL